MKYLVLILIPIHITATWQGQWRAAHWYEHFMPITTINTTYNGYYPYWGYGLGLGRSLDTMAQDQAWTELQTTLQKEYDQLLNHQPTNPRDQNIARIRLSRIQLHLDGITHSDA